MPIYEYLCERGHRFDALQKFADDPLESCEVCGTSVRKVLHPIAVHFKGSGFHNTDYGRGRKSKAEGESASSETKSESSSGKDSKSDSTAPKSDTKSSSSSSSSTSSSSSSSSSSD